MVMVQQAPVAFDRVSVATPAGPRVALVAAPTEDIGLDATRLAELRRPVSRPSAIDDAIVEAARATPNLSLFVWRSSGPGGRWGFDPTLSDEETAELGYHVVRSLLPLFRRLVASGCLLAVHVDLGFREAEALKDGAARLRDETEAGGSATSTSRLLAASVRALDQWILRHFAMYLASSYATVMSGTLPTMWSMVDRRAQVTRPLVEALPPGVV